MSNDQRLFRVILHCLCIALIIEGHFVGIKTFLYVFILEILRVFFEELYQLDIISEETFYAWEASKEFPEGKGPALSSVKQFLQWLRKAEEEPNEDKT